MEIIHTEKQPLITSLRNLNPTDNRSLQKVLTTNRLYMVVMPADKYYNSMVVNLETGKVKYFNCNIIVQLAACIIAVNV